jgi:hypothetical protein
MSEFVKQAFYTFGDLRPKNSPLKIRVELKPEDYNSFEYQRKYRLTAQYCQEGWIDESAVLEGARHKVWESTMQQFKRQLCDSIYGDLTKMMHGLQKAINEEDYNEARNIMDMVWKEMRS